MMTKDQVVKTIAETLAFIGEEKYTIQLKEGKAPNTLLWTVALTKQREMIGCLAVTDEKFLAEPQQLKMDVLWIYLLKSHPESVYLKTCLAALSQKNNAPPDGISRKDFEKFVHLLPEECSNEPLAILMRYYASREVAIIVDELQDSRILQEESAFYALVQLTRRLKEISQLELAARLYYKETTHGKDPGSSRQPRTV